MVANPSQHRNAIDKFRAYYDDTLTRHVGARPPEPFAGQTVTDYRIEALRSFKQTYLPRAHKLYGVNFRRTAHNLRNDSAALNDFLSVMEPQLLAACRTEANNPAHVPRGELKKIEEYDQTGHLKMIKFIGQESFVKQMMRPGRRVVGFRTDKGYMNTNGQFLR
jgi:hypothetical protein